MSEHSLLSLETLLGRSADGFVLVESDGAVRYVNPAGLALLGLERHGEAPFTEWIDGRDREALTAGFAEALGTEAGSIKARFRSLPQAGSDLMECDIGRDRDAAGKDILILNFRACAERKQMDGNGLDSQSHLFDMLLGNLPLMACRIDKRGIFTESRGLALRGAGLADGEVVGMDALEGWPDCRHFVEKALRGEPVHFEWVYGEGERRCVNEVWLQPDLSEGGVVGFAVDVTERRRIEEALRHSEEQLRQSQKMEAVGRLAGGVAHDFNNLLTAINGYGELLMQSLRDTDPLQSTVAEIRRAGDRAASLTRQLLTFSRRQVMASQVLDLNKVVGEIRQMLCRLIGEDIHLVMVVDPGLAKIKTDPGQMEQVILNLALNARDAMPTGGTLTIETGNACLDASQGGTYFATDPGSYVMLSVTDTGIGMSEEVKAHLFEPFFTTKPPGKGTGLGLSTVYGIVKAAGGNISVASEPGRGTSFSVYLPVAKVIKDEAERDRIPEKAPRSGRETILLVEDEDMVRRLVGQVLLSQGYNVLEAGSGMAALEVVGRFTGTIDLLLTDVVMAGMSGRELAEKLLADIPSLKVLYMSGYTDDATLRHGVFQNSAAFLGKPFSPGFLARKLREVLDGVDAAKRDPVIAPT